MLVGVLITLGVSFLLPFAFKYINDNNNKKSTTNPDEANETSSLDYTENQSALGKPIPLVMGKTLVRPMYIGNPYTTLSGEDGKDYEFHCLYALGQRRLQVRNIKLGRYEISHNDGVTAGVKQRTGNLPDYETPETTDLLNGFPAVDNSNLDPIIHQPQVEIRQDDFNYPSIYNQKVVQDKFDTELLPPVNTHYENVYAFSARNPQKVQFQFQLNGIYDFDSDNNAINREIIIGIEYSIDGGNSWAYLNSNNISSHSITVEPVQIGEVSEIFYKFKGNKSGILRYAITQEFAWSDLFNNDGTSKLTDGYVRYRISRITSKSSNDNAGDTIILNNITTWCFNYDSTKNSSGHNISVQRPINQREKKRLTLLGFSIKSSQNIEQNLKELSCECTSLCKIWDSTNHEWGNSYVATDNPAALALHCMTDEYIRGQYAYNTNKIDLAGFGKFYEWCDVDTDFSGTRETSIKRFAFDGLIESQQKTITIINDILSYGRGCLVRNGKKYSILYDCPRTDDETVSGNLLPKLILNNQNVISAKNSKAFNDIPDGLIVSFRPAINDYERYEILVKPNDCTLSESEMKLQKIEIPYCIDAYRAKATGLYELAKIKLRPEVWNRTVSVDGSYLNIGDLIQIQDDTIAVGIGEGAEVTDFIYDDEDNPTEIVGIKTDGLFDVTDYSQSYSVKITETSDNDYPNIVERNVVFTENGVYSDFTFETPIALTGANKPRKNDILSFGFSNNVVTNAILLGKKDNGNGTYDLTLIPYQNGVYTAEQGFIADFENNVTPRQFYQQKTLSLEDLQKNQAKVVQGEKGDSGNGISSIDYYYATTGTQTTPDASSVTSTTIPTMSANDKYLWQKEVIHFTDSGAADKVTVALIGVYGDDGTGRETIALTSPSTPSGTYVNQLGVYKNQIYKWNGSEWIKQDSEVDTLNNNIYCHYSFDSLNEIPHGSSYRYNKENNWTTSDYWTKANNDFTQSIVSNKLRLTCTNDCNMHITKSMYVAGNDLFYIKFKAYGTMGELKVYDDNNLVIDSDDWAYNTDVVRICKLGSTFSTRTIGIQFHEAEAGSYVDIEIVKIFAYAFFSREILDNSGNNHKITDNSRNTVYLDSEHGKCIRQYGASYFQTEPQEEVGKTFSVWFKSFDSGSRRTILCTNYNNGLIVDVNNGTLRFYYYSSWQTVKSVNINTWYHLVVSITSTQVICYLNGEKLKTQNHSQTTHSYNHYIGALAGNGSNGFIGLVDEYIKYDRVLSDQEVYALYLQRGNLKQNYSYDDYLLDQKANLVFSKNPIALNKRRDNKSMYSNYSCYVYMSLVRGNNELYPLNIADVVLDTTDLPSYCSLSKDVSDDSNYSVKLTLTFGERQSSDPLREATNFRIGLTVNGQNGVTYYNYIDVVYNQYGKYIGAIKAIDNGTGGTRTVTMLDDTTKTISEGDYFVWAGTQDDGDPFYISHLYQFMATNSSTYVFSEYVTDEDVATALGDIGSVIDRANSPNTKGLVYIKNLVSNNAFINNLSSQKISFKDYVASQEVSAQQQTNIGDWLISMGKNPKNLTSSDYAFIIQQCIEKNGASEVWMKHLWTSVLASGLISLGVSGCVFANQDIYTKPASVIELVSNNFFEYAVSRMWCGELNGTYIYLVGLGNGDIYRSTDCVTWVRTYESGWTDSQIQYCLWSICKSNNKVYALQGEALRGHILESSDGINWNSLPYEHTGGVLLLQLIPFGENIIITTQGYTENYIINKNNEVIMTDLFVGIEQEMEGVVVYNPTTKQEELFITGTIGTEIYKVTYNQQGEFNTPIKVYPNDNEVYNSDDSNEYITFGNGIIAVCTEYGNVIYSKNYGISWNVVNLSNSVLQVMAYGNGIFTIATNSGTDGGKIYVTPDFENIETYESSSNFGWNECRYDERKHRWLIGGIDTSSHTGEAGVGIIYSANYAKMGAGITEEVGWSKNSSEHYYKFSNGAVLGDSVVKKLLSNSRSLLTTTGNYVKFNNGLLIQWRKGTTTTSANYSISLPQPYSANSSYCVFVSQNYRETGNNVQLQTQIKDTQNVYVNAKDLQANNYYARDFFILTIGI